MNGAKLFLPVFAILLTIYLLIINKKVLIGICCIDERVNELYQTVDALQKENIIYNKDIIRVFRKSDVKCKKVIPYLEVPDYDIPKNKRHNIENLVIKRNAILSYAKQNNYDNLIFIDSDIIIEWYTLFYLMIGHIFADIVIAPYNVRWASMTPVLGYDNPPRIELAKTGLLPFYRCHVGGMGCTSILLKSPKIPSSFSQGSILGIEGEDIGFFMEARKNGAVVASTSWHIVNHIK